jgi:hypothetical protein
MRPAILIALLATAAATPCLATEMRLAANGIPVDPDRSVSGHFDAADTQAWRVYLRAGRSYAVWAYGSDPLAVRVAAAGGKALASFGTPDDETSHGASLRAPYTGLYAVEVTCTAGTAADCSRASYSLSAGRDCPGDASTRCGIAAGATLHGLQGRFLEDDDWFRTSLRAGTRYVVVATDEGRDEDARIRVRVRDARGRVVADNVGACPIPCPATYTPRAAGTYFVEVSAGDSIAAPTYSLSLAPAR